MTRRTKRRLVVPTRELLERGWNDARERMNKFRGGRLGWLLDFLSNELDTLREGEWLDLRYDLLAFPYAESIESAREHYPTREEIHRFQEEVREGLKTLLKGEPWEPKDARIEIKLRRIKEDEGPPKRVKRVHIERRYKATWRAACLSRVADLLNAQDDRLRQCMECGKVFLAVKRQAYCSTRCSQTTRTRRHREAQRRRTRQKS